MALSGECLIDEIQKRRPKSFDTCPTLSERLAAVASFPDVTPFCEKEPAIELISDLQAIEAELTRMLTSRMSELSYD